MIPAPYDAERWSTCTAALHHCKGFEKEQQSEWAAEGEALHEQVEMLLGEGLGHPDPVVQAGLDWIEEWGAEELLLERSLALDLVYPGMKGRLDVGGWRRRPDIRLMAFDWKFGRGEAVSPVENKQLTIYARGLYDRVWQKPLGDPRDRLKIPVDFVIWQPFNAGGGGVWETTLGWVLEESERLAGKAKEAVAGPGVYVPGAKACRFCPGAKLDRCLAHAEWHLKALGKKENSDEMSHERREEVWRQARHIKRWLGQVEARLLDDCRRLGPQGGVKAVEGERGDRFWPDEEKACAFLQEVGVESTKTVVRSPAQVEDEIPPSAKDRFSALYARKPSQPKLVDSTDKRPALVPIADIYEDL